MKSGLRTESLLVLKAGLRGRVKVRIMGRIMVSIIVSIYFGQSKGPRLRIRIKDRFNVSNMFRVRDSIMVTGL